MYKFMNDPYLNHTFFEADKGGGAGGAGAAEDESEDTDSEDSETDSEEDPDEKKFSKKDLDNEVKKQLSKEKRKWQREQKKSTVGKGKTSEETSEEEAEADRKVREAEERAFNAELKWTCLEHDVKKDCVDDVLALARVHMKKDVDMDIEDAIDEVLKKYPHFKTGTEEPEDDAQQKKGWGQRHKGGPSKSGTVEDEIRKQLFGK